MKKVLFFIPLLLLAACHSSNENDTEDNSKAKATEKIEEAPKKEEKKVPSEEWIIASFTDGDLGFMTEDETTKIKGEYSFLRHFKNQHSSARNSKNRLMGLIDENGKIIIPFEYHYTSDYGSGLLAVRKTEDGKVSYINLEAKEIIPANYDMGFAFNNGLARVAIGKYEDALSMKRWEKAKYGFINNKGEEIVEIKYDWASDFSDGIAAVQEGSKYYFIDTTGAQVGDVKYKFLSGFKGNLCAAGKGMKIGFINKQMEEVIPAQYDNYKYFFDITSKYSFGTSHESELGKTSFQNAEGFFFLQKGKKWGIVDINNEALTKFKYDDLEIPAEDGYIQYKKRGKFGYGTYEKGVVTEFIPAEYDYIYHYPGHELFIVAKGKYSSRKHGAVNKIGELVIPCKWDDVDDIGFGFASIEKDDKYAVVNEKGEQITELIYDYVGSYNKEDGKIHVKKGDDYIYIDPKGKEIKD
jgi:hypothetical protein